MNNLILISDYDGTIKQNNLVTKTFIDCVDKFRSERNIFGISSGRSITSLLNDVNNYGIKYDFLIGCNGTIGINNEGVILFEDYINFEDVMKLIDILQEEQIEAMFVSDGFDSVPYFSHNLLDDSFLKNLCNDDNNITKIMKFKKISTVIIKFDVNSNHELIGNTVANISNNIEYYANMNYIDIVPKGNSKASGIEKVMNNYQNENIFVIGDDYNDLSMINKFNGFAITNSPKEVLDAASKLFDNVEDCLKFIMEDNNDQK